jgi:hypothetical protein
LKVSESAGKVPLVEKRNRLFLKKSTFTKLVGVRLKIACILAIARLNKVCLGSFVEKTKKKMANFDCDPAKASVFKQTHQSNDSLLLSRPRVALGLPTT